MTFDEFFRWIVLPAMGTAAFLALIISIRQFWQEVRREW